MIASDGFAAFLRDELAPLGRVTARRMFGKTGLFLDGAMLGMLRGDALYLSVDDGNREALAEAASSLPLSYGKGGRTLALAFWRAPARLLDDPDELRAWAGLALAAARRAARRGEAARRPG